MTKKDEIISIYSDHDPDDWESIKKAMVAKTDKKLKSIKQVIIDHVLNERR